MSELAYTVLVVGAGPVGRAIAAGLQRAGVALRHWSRSSGPLWEEGGPAAPVDVVVLAVRDEVIPEAAAFIVTHGAAGAGTVLIHCAGALAPEAAFAGVRAQVRGVGLLHPLRSLPDRADAADLAGTVLGVGGDEAGAAVASELAEALGGVPLPLRSDQLAAYHAAAVMSAGHVAALLDLAVGVLVGVGLPRRQAEQALAALCRSAADNVAEVGLPLALTGPFARGDAATVGRHLQALPAVSPEAARVYRALAPQALSLARHKGDADEEALARIAALIDEAQAT